MRWKSQRYAVKIDVLIVEGGFPRNGPVLEPSGFAMKGAIEKYLRRMKSLFSRPKSPMRGVGIQLGPWKRRVNFPTGLVAAILANLFITIRASEGYF